MDTTRNIYERLSEAIGGTDFNWTLCLVGEDQAEKMSELTKGLRGDLRTGEGKHVTSGFAYWGIGPTIAWSNACSDVFYPVMKESLRNFKYAWRRVHPGLDGGRWHYVSLGVGNGQKDHIVLEHLNALHPLMIYFPVDMSSDMLGLGSRETSNVVGFDRTVPIQLDISNAQNLVELKRLLRHLLGDEPILFGLLGNTLANFDADEALLRSLGELLRPQDRFLLEVATTTTVAEEVAHAAAEEYVSSRFFREFVTSSLLHHTDLTIDMDSVEFHGSVEQAGRALRIEVRYHNKSGETIRLTLPSREIINFAAEQSVQVYLTRKYSALGLQGIIDRVGLVKVVTTEDQPDDRRRVFGIDLLLLANDPNARRISAASDVANEIVSPRRSGKR
jgi:L-histidine Nalpha-methyltransferase